jgi:hypothetical protein
MKRTYPVIDGVVVKKINNKPVYCKCHEEWDYEIHDCVDPDDLDIHTQCDVCGFYVWTHRRKSK